MFRERDVDERKCVLLKIPRCDIDGVKGSDRNFKYLSSCSPSPAVSSPMDTGPLRRPSLLSRSQGTGWSGKLPRLALEACGST